ncbi:MAG TPA: hypothetical protein VGD54_04440 [Steroidobacteraceae bacterium]
MAIDEARQNRSVVQIDDRYVRRQARLNFRGTPRFFDAPCFDPYRRLLDILTCPDVKQLAGLDNNRARLHCRR